MPHPPPHIITLLLVCDPRACRSGSAGISSMHFWHRLQEHSRLGSTLALTALCLTNKNGPLLGAQAHTNTQAYLNSRPVPPRSRKKIGRRSLTTTTPRQGLGLSAPRHARGVTHWGARFKSAAQAKFRFDRAGAARQVGKPLAQKPEPAYYGHRGHTVRSLQPLEKMPGATRSPASKFFLAATVTTLLGFRPENRAEKRCLIRARTARPAAGRTLCARMPGSQLMPCPLHMRPGILAEQ